MNCGQFDYELITSQTNIIIHSNYRESQQIKNYMSKIIKITNGVYKIKQII